MCEDGFEALPFGLGVEGRGAWAGRFAAEVDDVGAFRNHIACASEGFLWAKEFAAIGKGIWRDIDDAHHERVLHKSNSSC